MTADDKNAKFEAAVDAMAEHRFYDVTIVCTTDDYQAEFWMTKLSKSITKTADDNFPMVIAVSEDWTDPSGAGNGLGTLYAWQKACRYANKNLGGVDLDTLLLEGKISAALYHTAGKGTRMAPLPASENNNKPGVKLPFPKALTVLESVVRQTGIYAASRKGRLSVYWGDQVFLPSVDFEYKPAYHIDILCSLLGETAPNAQEWKEQGLDKYGVIAVLKSDGSDAPEAAQVEKVSHETATKMLEQLGTIGQVGPSLGSFSVSASMLKGLCDEFSVELADKQAKFDTDPHFWMPMTLPEDSYVYLMSQKDVDEATSKTHYERMKAFSTSFLKSHNDMGLFGAVDVGKDACWWDYGQLQLYSKNSLLLLDDANPESKLLRKFLNLTENPMTGVLASNNVMYEHSYAFDCTIAEGTAKDSLLSHVTAKEINVDGAIVVNCVAPKITAGKGCILYNIMGEREIVAEPGQVMVAVSDESGSIMEIKSRVDIDGGQAWKEVVEGNPMSFEQVWKNNKNAQIGKIDLEREELFIKLSEKVFEP
ncbi:hypothetical protein IV203_011705 [Nitzschia inconspicua]|uniref:Uncharacterized protein n=1 Tax=Nitzschia inconspicua TaxID=303405 RepID=A0A9K3PIW9_9STRA|nr:hypothetical protein IV203_011705 [Nitzschia inconspicua]